MTVVLRHVAIFVPSSGGRLASTNPVPPEKYEFVLVADRDQYQRFVEAGEQPILVSRNFSETDTRGRYRLKLGSLILPWRWRRLFLNENIRLVAVLRGRGATAVIFGAVLAGTHWRHLGLTLPPSGTSTITHSAVL